MENNLIVWAKNDLTPFSEKMKEYKKYILDTFSKWNTGNKDSRIIFEEADYGILPSTTKPTLFKKGAKKIIDDLGLKYYFKPIVNNNSILMECILTKNGETICQGWGGGFGNGDKEFNKGVKMAKKRALVDAVLELTGLNMTADLDEEFRERIASKNKEPIGKTQITKISNWIQDKNISNDIKNEVKDIIISFLKINHKIETEKPCISELTKLTKEEYQTLRQYMIGIK